MSEPQGNHRAVHAVLEELHSGRMAQDMGRDALLLSRVAVLPCCRHVFGQQIRDPVTTECTAAGVGNHGGHRTPLAFSQPHPHGRSRVLAQRGAAFLPSFAGAVHMGSSPKHDVLTLQARAFRHAEPGLHRDQS
jgi:hypothetical protein